MHPTFVLEVRFPPDPELRALKDLAQPPRLLPVRIYQSSLYVSIGSAVVAIEVTIPGGPT